MKNQSTPNQKFNTIIDNLAYDLNMAWDNSNFMEKNGNWTAFIDPHYYAVLDFIVKADGKGHESFNDVAKSIMTGNRKFDWCPLRFAVVEVFEQIVK